MIGAEFNLRDVGILCIGNLPMGKRPYLYLQEGAVATVLASFRDEAAAQKAIDFLSEIAVRTLGEKKLRKTGEAVGLAV